VNAGDYEYLRKLLKERSGLVLAAGKQYLVESRLLPVIRRLGIESLAALIAKLRRGEEAVIVEVVEAMAVNETFFYRDKRPFDNFSGAIAPALLAARRAARRLRIWCAAASTGQEPYSLVICLKEMGARLAGWQVEILATDLSLQVLDKASAGIYSQFEVQRGLPIQHLIKYFIPKGETWQVAPDIRAMVQFRQFNLLHDFAPLGRLTWCSAATC
jgi:chemotaxis protein methyltransferase CheR